MTERKPILCLDFDGVLHSYTSGWKSADVIPDEPVNGMVDFLVEASKHFEIHVYSSRSHREGGIFAMQQWLCKWIQVNEDVRQMFGSNPVAEQYVNEFVCFMIKWPTEKPKAIVTLDDRAMQFTGEWPTIETLQNFKPWNESSKQSWHERHGWDEHG